MNQALSHEKLNAWDKARELYTAILPESDNYQRAQLLIAQSLVKEGKNSEAVAHYQSIMDALDTDNRSLAEIKLADLLRSEERYAEAAVEYANVVAGNPTGEYADDAQYLVGLCYYKGAKAASDDAALLDKSVTAFEKSIGDYPDSPNAVESYYGLALAYRDMALAGNISVWPKVLEVADTAYAQHGSSDNTTVQKTLGHIDLVKATAIEKQGLDSEEEKVELIASLRRIAQNTSAPEDSRSRAQLKIGHLYYGDGEHEKALAEYQVFVQMFPNSELVSNALYQASVCYYQIGQNSTDEGARQLAFQNAVNTATQVTEINPDVEAAISAYYTIGLAKHALNDRNGAIAAFRQTTSYEGQTEDKPRQDLIRQAHTRLADLNTAVGDHAAAVREYQYVIQHTEDDDQKGRSYFSIAYAQDEHLDQYDDSLLNYQNAIQLSKDTLIKAQAYYRMGLIYQEELNDPENALKAYETLISQFGAESNTSIQSMAADGGIRRSDLYLKLGRVKDAIAQAVAALEAAQTVPQKVSAQYNLGLLYFGEARKLFSDKPGTDLQPYIDASRKAAASYVEAANIAPADKVNDTISPFVQNALFTAGQIYYSLGTGIKLPDDLNSAIPVLKQFAEYADKGIFAASSQADVSKTVQIVLGYLAPTYYELGRMQLGFDEGFSEKTISFFEQSASVFMDLAKRFPNAKEAPFWQYQAGEAYFAGQQHLKAVEEYKKVRRINPQHAQAAESLAAISTCYALLEKSTEDEAEKEEWLDKVFEVNEILAKNYPTSPFAAEAFLNIGNTYYNQGVLDSTTEEDRIRLYTMAIDQYEKALAVPGINAESKENADLFLRETRRALSADVYIQATTNFDRARVASEEEQRAAVEQAIAGFQDIIKTYPTTKYADLSLVQIGEAYMLLAGENDEYYNDALDSFDALWSKYATVPPSDTQVNKALRYAQTKITEISEYMRSQNIPRRTGGGGGGE